MPPLGTREYEKGPRGNSPLEALKAELIPAVNRLVVRSWQAQFPDHPKDEGRKIVETPKLHSYKNASGLLVSAWAKGKVSPDGKIVVAEIITQDVAREAEVYTKKSPEKALVQVNIDEEKVFASDDKGVFQNSLTYDGEVHLMEDALVTVKAIDSLF